MSLTVMVLDSDQLLKERAIELRAQMISTDMWKLLLSLEWSGRLRGADLGPSNDFPSGASVSVCPVCQGVNPKDNYASLFFAHESHGHRPGCEMQRIVAYVRGEGRREREPVETKKE